MQFFLTNLSLFLSDDRLVLGLACEMSLEKIALMTTARSYESTLKLLSSLANCVKNSCSCPCPKELFNTTSSVAVFLKTCHFI